MRTDFFPFPHSSDEFKKLATASVWTYLILGVISVDFELVTGNSHLSPMLADCNKHWASEAVSCIIYMVK